MKKLVMLVAVLAVMIGTAMFTGCTKQQVKTDVDSTAVNTETVVDSVVTK